MLTTSRWAVPLSSGRWSSSAAGPERITVGALGSQRKGDLMFFDNLGKPWWLAYLITFVITVVVIRWDGLLFEQGIDGRPAGLIALATSSVVAITVWLLLRHRFVYEDTSDTPPRPNRPPQPPSLRRRKR